MFAADLRNIPHKQRGDVRLCIVDPPSVDVGWRLDKSRTIREREWSEPERQSARKGPLHSFASAVAMQTVLCTPVNYS